MEYYLRQVGGPTEIADHDRIFIIRADGTVVSKRQNGYGGVSWDSVENRWISGDLMSVRLHPGDTVLVPREITEFEWLKTTKDITQILYQIAVAAGVVIAAF